MRYNHIYYNGISSEELDLIATTIKLPNVEKRINTITVNGRDGDVYIDTGNYEDIEIEISLAFVTNTPNEWNDAYRQAKNWLMGIPGKLCIYYDNDYYYKVKHVTIDEPSRMEYDFGGFTATFICDPWQYLFDGDIPITFQPDGNGQQLLYAPNKCKPEYYISGEGHATLTVNGNAVTANLSSSLIIDTNLMLCYKITNSGSVIANTDVSGVDLEDIRFVSGENTISITDGFTLNITPHWRVI